MRSIKFRAWDRKEKRMVCCEEFSFSPYYIQADGVVLNLDNIDEKHRHVRLPYTLMQFTGFLDKQGKEVYEGDILKFNSSLYALPDIFYEVFWSEGGAWYIKLIGSSKPFDEVERINGFHLSYGEVVGNIYKCPGLLK